jgi:hypothetical protein
LSVKANGLPIPLHELRLFRFDKLRYRIPDILRVIVPLHISKEEIHSHFVMLDTEHDSFVLTHNIPASQIIQWTNWKRVLVEQSLSYALYLSEDLQWATYFLSQERVRYANDILLQLTNPNMLHTPSWNHSKMDTKEIDGYRQRYEKHYVWFCEDTNKECTDIYIKTDFIKIAFNQVIFLFKLEHVRDNIFIKALQHVFLYINTFELDITILSGFIFPPDYYINEQMEIDAELIINELKDNRKYFGNGAAFIAFLIRLTL